MGLPVAAAIGGSALLGAYSSNKAADAAAAGTKEGIKASQYASNMAQEQIKPWYNAGENALNSYNSALGLGGSYTNTPMTWDEYIVSDQVPSKNRKEAYAGYLNRFDQGDWIPDGGSPTGPGMYDEFEGGNRFTGDRFNGSRYDNGDRVNWDTNALLNDPGYQFTRDQALQGTQRAQNAGGNAVSGNVLTALQDRAGGVSAQYGDMFRRANLAENNENYRRDIGENDLNYGRSFNESNLNYGRDIGENELNYGRDLNEWNINERGRNMDMYGRDQNYLNRLEGLSRGGQNAAAQQGSTIMNSGAAQGGYAVQGGAADASAWTGLNNAAQGGISNYLTHDLYKNNPYLEKYPPVINNNSGMTGYR